MFHKISDVLLGVLFGLLSAGLILLVCRSGSDTAVLLRPPPTSSPIKVDVDGAVAVPGVYSLPAGSRVEDAVIAAGGLQDNAYRGAVNLAEILEDGMHLYIPVRITASSLEGQIDHNESSSGNPAGVVNINFASQEILESLPGIGPVTAEAIISFRSERPFSRIEDLQKVTGIGPATFEKLKDRITVGE